jgi:hypothetical protein
MAATCVGHAGAVNCIDIDKVNMKWMISGGQGKYIKAWSIYGGECL